ncbi:MAG TPA: hypothetical protein ENK07_05380 [Bacteroidetes bacterium]|nr:hypothetical protein [Bacteroidota bacterium]
MRNKLVVGLILGLLVAGCHEREPSPLEPQSNAPPLPVPYQIATPNAIRAPQQVVEAANQINAYTAIMVPYVTLAQQSQPQPTDSGWVWPFNMGMLSAKLIAKRKGDTTRWEVRLSGNDGYRTYNNWLALEGETSSTHQRWVRYSEESNAPIAKVLVDKLAGGKVKVLVKAAGTACTYRAEVQSDSTTTVECVRNEKVTFRAQWKPGKRGEMVYGAVSENAKKVTWRD